MSAIRSKRIIIKRGKLDPSTRWRFVKCGWSLVQHL